MKYLSLFSGIGGFELGIQQAYEDYLKCQHIGKESEQKECTQRRFRSVNELDKMLCDSDRTAPLCVGYSEIDKYAIQVYEKHFNYKNYGDATKIDTKQLPDFDLLVGGFPCQAFSIAGKRRGFDEARGTLFFDIARILADKKPRNFILENVKGLLSHDGGRTFTTIIRILSTMGYFVEWQVLNAKNFGVPQNRERVFIVGHLGGQPRRKVFPITESNPKTLNQIIEGGQGNRVYGTDGISTTQASQAGGQGSKTGLYAVPAKWQRTEKGKEFRKEAMQNGEDKTPFGNEYRELVPKDSDVIGTITIQAIAKDSLVFQKTRIRRLTPMECERLMGYPDNWTLEGTQGKISDTQRYKMCGNGIVSNVVKEVVKRILTVDTSDC